MRCRSPILTDAGAPSGAPGLDPETWVIEPPKRPGAPSITPLSFAMGGKLSIVLAVVVFLLPAAAVRAQWEIEDSHTTASLRGIHNVGGGIAWASGTAGTVLRTLNDGKTWQTCPIPLAGTKDTAEKLDFRGIQAFDAQTAIVMSSGPGDLSRLYKTTDGCQTWKLLFTNPDKDGFWDAIRFTANDDPMSRGKCFGTLLGDPVARHFTLFVSLDCGTTWERQKTLPAALPGEGAFAASNSSLTLLAGIHARAFVTGGLSGPRYLEFSTVVGGGDTPECEDHTTHAFSYESNMWCARNLPATNSSEASGAFALDQSSSGSYTKVIVGGDYKNPDQRSGTAWYFGQDSFKRFTYIAARTQPHGYRSAVAYEEKTKTWITVGPSGTDISTDDGRNWHPLTPGPGEDKDADKNWNALSLPFVVGPEGRVGKLRSTALASVAPSKQAKP